MGLLGSLFGSKESDEIKRLREAANAGDAKAMYNLGYAYMEGKGVKLDIKTGLDWLLKSADAGDDVAQLEVGVVYESGNSYVKKDCATALALYQKSAAQGNTGALVRIANVYTYGIGVQKDYAVAREYFQKIISKNDEFSVYGMYGLAILAYEGWGQDVDYETAVYWYRKAAELGEAASQNDLGWCYENGYGVEKDTSEAIMWYRKAAAQGNQLAKENLRNLGINV